MDISVVRLADYVDRCAALLRGEYNRLRNPDALGESVVNWDIYRAFDDKDMLLLVVAEEDGKLAGFSLYVMYVHPHHPDKYLAQCQILAVEPEHRHKHVASTLIEHAELVLKKLTCTHMLHNARMAYYVSPLFPKLGFTKLEENYVKELK